MKIRRHPLVPFLLPLLCAAPLAAAPGSGVGDGRASLASSDAAAAIGRGVGLQPGLETGTWIGGGPDYKVSFDAAGCVFTPALGSDAPRAEPLGFRFASLSRGDALLATADGGAPVAEGAVAHFARAGGVQERWTLTPQGVELSFLLPEAPAGDGDLIARLALDSALAGEPSAAGGLHFHDAAGRGTSVGRVYGVDAAGWKVDGELRLSGEVLELSLPDAFLDAASYPVLLDPLVGTVKGVSVGINDDSRPDLAYDASTDSYLVVWTRTFSASNVDIRGQRINSLGNSIGSVIFFGSAGVAQKPQVANLNTPGTFAVVWQEEKPGTIPLTTNYTIELATVRATDGAIVAVQDVASTTLAPLTDPDVGGEGVKNVGTDADFIVVYDDQNEDEIRARHMWVRPDGTIGADSPFLIAADVPQLLSFVSRPRISKATGVYDRFLVVYQRNGFAGGNDSIAGRMVHLTGGTASSSITLSDTTYNAILADVDGFDIRFVVTWEAIEDNNSSWIQARPVDFSLQTLTLSAKPIVDVSPKGNVLFDDHEPVVAFGLGKSFIAWRENNFLNGAAIRLRGFDSASCIPCEGPLYLDSITVSTDPSVALASPHSGGAYYDDRAMASWTETGAENEDLFAQALTNNNHSGSTVDLGGGCGSGGFQTHSGQPSIGTNWYIFGLVGLPVTSPVAVLNLSAPGLVPLTCGGCAITPWQTTVTANTQSNGVTSEASVAVTIPCNPALIGAQLESQWTSFTPGTSPCNLLPQLSFSHRVRLTLGN
jgi:hypothetical protein